MKHCEGRFTGSGGHSIYYQCWEPESTPRALLLVAHGLGEHSARYLSLARYFVGHDYAVAALDHNGHGCSEGSPGYVQAFDDYTSDLAMFQDVLATRYPEMPVFLLGHSMGGLISGCYLLQAQDRFSGAILSGPVIRTGEHPGPIQLFLIRLLASLIPRLGLKKLDANGVSRDAEVVSAYINDPLVYHGKLSARLLREFFAGIGKLETNAGNLRLPLLILHGGEDVMVSPEGSRMFYSWVSSPDKTLKIYPGLYHEIFNEPERAEVLADVLGWCEKRLGDR